MTEYTHSKAVLRISSALAHQPRLCASTNSSNSVERSPEVSTTGCDTSGKGAAPSLSTSQQASCGPTKCAPAAETAVPQVTDLPLHGMQKDL
mgnify:CR=1 FL=1